MHIDKKKIVIFAFFILTATFGLTQIEVVHETGDSGEYGQNPITETELPIYNVGAPDYDQVWKNFKELMLRNSFDDALAEVSRLLTMKDGRKLERLTFYALALANESYNYYKKFGEKEKALQLFKVAQSLDPKLPDAYFLPFYIEMKGGLSVFGGIGNFIEGIKASLDDPLNRMSTMSVVFNLIIKSLIYAALFFVAFLYFKYQRNLRYDAVSMDIFGNNETMKKFSGWFILLLPFVFWLGFEFILLYLLVVLLPYARPSLKIAGLLIFIGLIFYVPWIKYNNALLKTINDDNAKFTLLADKAFYTHELNEMVSAHRRNEKSNQDLEITQARILMYYGKMADSYNAYRILNKKYPRRTDILISLGNIRYYNGSYELAKIHYEAAMRLEPDNVYALFNYKLATEQLDPFRDTTDLKRQIINLNPQFYDSISTSEGEKKELIEIYLPEKKKIAEADEMLKGYLFEGDSTKKLSSLLFTSPLPIAAIIGFIVFLVSLMMMRERGHAEKCQKCLRVFKKPARGDDLESKYCKQCVSIFFKKEGVSPEVQRAKIVQINQVRKKERNLKLILSLFIPGARNIYSDRGLSGFLILWKWILLIMIVFTGNSLNLNPFRAVDLSFGPMKIIALILLVQTQVTSIILGFVRINKGE